MAVACPSLATTVTTGRSPELLDRWQTSPLHSIVVRTRKAVLMRNIRIEQGLLSGAEQDGVHRFLGLPFAQPPVGELRWQPPRPPSGWDGVRDATKFGNAAIQTANTGFDVGASQSEDCLYLNVWTTDPDPASRQPVMVWMHGGGFLNGAASMKLWTGEELARRGVTVVSVNYRLGAFGFLTHPDVGSNFGVLDWVAALSWISKNIQAFGGDPDNVTIFGQSAGGAAVRALLSTKTAKGLFHRAIIQSAGFEDYAVVDSPSYQRSAAATEKLFDQLGSHDIDVLRQVPTEKVRAASLGPVRYLPADRAGAHPGQPCLVSDRRRRRDGRRFHRMAT